MPSQRHAPEWPDKILAAALLVAFAGLLAVLQAGLVASGATWSVDDSLFMAFIPTWWTLLAGALTAAFGVVAYRHQSWVFTLLGIITGIISFGMLGASTLLSLVAIWPMLRSFREGEETHLDRHRVHAHQWPDKAILASVVLAVGGALSLMQAAMLALGRIAAPVLPDYPVSWAVFSAVAGLVALTGARDAFHLRRAWTSWVGSGLVVAAAAFYVIGPVFGVLAMLFLGLAFRESEFLLYKPTNGDERVN